MDLSALSNEKLEEFTQGLFKSHALLNQKILQFLFEWERRKLYSKKRYTSLYDYLVREISLPPNLSYTFTRALRILLRFPEMIESLQSIPIDQLARLERMFKQQKIYDREAQRGHLNALVTSGAHYFFEQNKRFESESIDYIRPTSNGRLRAHLTLENQTIEKLQRLKGMLYQRGKGNFDDILSFTLEQTLKKVDRLQRVVHSCRDGKHSRSIAEGLKNAIWQRAKGKCENCGSDFCLEIDHVIPFARGGTNDLWNLRLLCHNCNQRSEREVFS